MAQSTTADFLVEKQICASLLNNLSNVQPLSGCGLFVALNELAVISAFEEQEKEAVRRSARKAELQEADKL